MFSFVRRLVGYRSRSIGVGVHFMLGFDLGCEYQAFEVAGFRRGYYSSGICRYEEMVDLIVLVSTVLKCSEGGDRWSASMCYIVVNDHGKDLSIFLDLNL